METGFVVASGVSVLCLVVLIAAGNRLARAAVAAFVVVLVGDYALFAPYASGLMAYLAERFL